MIKIENKMTGQTKLALFPVLRGLNEATRTQLGVSDDQIRAELDASGLNQEGVGGAVAESHLGSLGWSVVAKDAILGVTEAVAPLVDAFSTSISSDVLMDDVVPRVVVDVVSKGSNAAQIDPDDLSAVDNVKSYGVPVDMHLVVDSCILKVTALADGHRAVNKVLALIESVKSTAADYVLKQLVKADAKDVDGNPIAMPETIEVPAIGEGWDAGYINRNLTELESGRADAIVIQRKLYGAAKQAANTDLDIRALDSAVYPMDNLSGLGDGVVGFAARKSAAAVAMRVPPMMQGNYDSTFILTDGQSKLPIIVAQQWDQSKLGVRITVATMVGAARVVGENLVLLTQQTASDAA